MYDVMSMAFSVAGFNGNLHINIIIQGRVDKAEKGIWNRSICYRIFQVVKVLKIYQFHIWVLFVVQN